MSDPLPAYTAETLERSSIADLMRLLARDEDRVPRSVIDACAARGDEMLDAIADLLEKDYYWGEDQSDGEWWRLHHAAMILGLMESERAGELLLRFMRRMDEANDAALAEWLSGRWPALFRNKPASIVPALEAVAGDRSFTWFVRSDAVDSAIAWILARDPDTLDDILDRAARIAFAKDDDVGQRTIIGNTLLGFARARHRRGLEQLVDSQPAEFPVFSREDLLRIYAIGGEPPQWERFTDPWQFYEAEAIAERQQRWLEAAAQIDEEYDDGFFAEPYIRPGPKIGRNDPCPCGSGKKYKKCCMP